MEEIKNLPEADVEVVDIQFRPGQKVYFFDPDGVSYDPGDHVIIDTARGAEFGICTGGMKTTAGGITVAILAGLLASLIFKPRDKS